VNADHARHADASTREAGTTTRVLLVRHGRTPTTGVELPGRAPGLHLSETGREQAVHVAERLASLAVTALYSSPLERTCETAAPTVERTGLPLVLDDGLLECEVGDWTGRRLADLAQEETWQEVQHHPSRFRFPHGESFTEMQERMVTTVDRLHAAHPGGTIALFSHADPIRCLLAHALATPLDAFQRISVGPCSVSAIAYRAGGDGTEDPVILTMNSTDDPLETLVAS